MENPEHQNNQEKSVSTHKTKIEQGTVQLFLDSHYPDPISDLVTISGGEGSQAFSFIVNGEPRIIRVNKHETLGFKKDEYASKYYSSPAIPIPEIYEIGKIDDNLHFCISQKAEGKILTSFSTTELDALQPAVFDVLNAIHNADISDTKGYGKWDAEGNGDSQSWKECLLNVNKHVKDTSEGSNLFEDTFLEKDFWDKAYARLTELSLLCPEDRFLIHGDYGFDNVLSDGKNITGVIDWAGSKYGDYLYDVAWLSFWSKNIDHQNLYLEHLKKKGIEIKNFKERVLCYKLFIGLSSLSFYAYSGQKEKYLRNKESITNLLNN